MLIKKRMPMEGEPTPKDATLKKGQSITIAIMLGHQLRRTDHHQLSLVDHHHMIANHGRIGLTLTEIVKIPEQKF